MLKMAWKTVKKSRLSRGTNNHYTFDKKTTLCGQKIPSIVGEIFEAKNTCNKCLLKKEIVDLSVAGAGNRVEHFKKIVEQQGGKYETDGDWHIARWDTDLKSMYVAYGMLAISIGFGDFLNMMQNAIYYKQKDL